MQKRAGLENLLGEEKPQKAQLLTAKPIKIEFLKISYDRILTSNQKEYCDKHPECGMHEAIDIIRPKADQDYLDAVTFHCNNQLDNENSG